MSIVEEKKKTFQNLNIPQEILYSLPVSFPASFYWQAFAELSHQMFSCLYNKKRHDRAIYC